MEILDFPDEILELILIQIDGWRLAKVQRVCKRIYQVVSSLLKRDHIWRMFCVREVVRDIILDLTCETHLRGLNDNLQNGVGLFPTWKKIYTTWYRSRWVKSWLFIKTVLEVGTDHSDMTGVAIPAKTMKINGDFLVIGKKDVSVWNHLTCEKVATVSMPWPQTGVISVHPMHSICSPGERCLDVDKVSIPVTKFLVSFRCGSVMLDLEDLSTIPIFHQSVSLDISVWGRKIAISTTNDLMYGHRVFELDISLKPVLKHRLYGHKGHAHLVRIWGDEVVSIGRDQELLRWQIGPDYEDDISNHERLHIFKEMVTDIIYRGKLILCITIDGYLHICTNGYTFVKYNVLEMLNGSAKRMALKGSLFALASSSGKVHLYHVDNYSTFASINLEKPAFTETITTEYITSIEIGDDGDGPLVAVGTIEGHIIIIRWLIGY